MLTLLPACRVDQASSHPGSSAAEGIGHAARWTEPVDADDPDDWVVSYRAVLQGDRLIIEATHREGWHTYAMDNDVRAKQRLAGKMAVGIEVSTAFSIRGAAVTGNWSQTEPTDLSDTEIGWFTWGFPQRALFSARLEGIEGSRLVIGIRGQCCDADSCRDVDVELTLDPGTHRSGTAIDLDGLIAVRKPE